jgi:DUF1009 family protein
MKKIGLIAGMGGLPKIIAAEAKAKERDTLMKER